MRLAADAPAPDWDSIEFAFECADPENRAYYDTVTGEVCVTGPFEDDPGERERIDAAPQRYLEIDRLPTHERFQRMERFAREEVGDPQLRERLLRALEGRGPFRRFKEALLSAPPVRQRWFAYEAAALRRAIEQWFAERDLAVRTAPPWARGSDATSHAAGG
ncbi:UPF0158 family protein [Nannocystis bainbridge]|uniref:UPF0158 family protein n=1 Tax=Nannocystis bainbridge TaxID=2995303 RepID=A0ABT5DRT6_9BACT|nr:UPF0158 family protein [Nannocystis bainbridge]MDC0716367.1 UPF0158 family protein [Nannocystis bainbridge]